MRPSRPRTARVAVVTTTGGGAASVVDRLGLSGIETVAPDSESPIIDLTMTATAERYTAALDDLLASPQCDGVLAVVGSSAQFHPQLAVDPIVRSKRNAKPLAVFLTPHAERSLALLAERGVAAFRTPEAGAVCLGIADRAELDRGIRAMLERVPASRAVLVQKMESGLAEAIVGYRDDPVVGPIALVGAGGTLAEIYKDYALRLAPVSEDEAEEMIAEVKGLATLRGYRGLPRGDVRALAKAVAALSRLALIAGSPVAEAEINPLIVKREGVVAVDGLVAMKEQD